MIYLKLQNIQKGFESSIDLLHILWQRALQEIENLELA